MLHSLHSGHQGVTLMSLRAKDSMWWPGMFEDLSKVRHKCRQCITDAPTQPNAPPEPLPDIQYPFQQMCGDYMQVAGYAYLVLVDRYLGWPMVIRAQGMTVAKLISSLREFSRY